MPCPDRQALAAEIARQEARLTELEAERAAARRRLDALKQQLGAPSPSVDPTALSPRTNQQKVALFRSLFRGRVDVFPKYWNNPKKQREGYAPACANEWVRGLCEKPRVKCGECPHQAFIPVTDQVIADHLRGRHIAGVYPLLEDETCWFLAVDFDKGDWQSDVAAFRDTCQQFDVDPAVERSRSGKGGHVWFFFAEPVSAGIARQMACAMITVTMAQTDQLPMSSYDRLFPSQDTMPRGGFGNLIALPLQNRPRQQGNTVFVDADWKPYPDQWAYLTTLPRIEGSRVDALARAAVDGGHVIGASTTQIAGDVAGQLGLGRPLRPHSASVIGPLPSCVGVVLGPQLTVDVDGLPPALINQVRHLATFQNPEFYKKERMRLSTARTPRMISCVEEQRGGLVLPRGCLPKLEELMGEHGVKLAVDDQRVEGESLALEFHGDLTDLQQQAVRELLPHDTGVFVAPPGLGKTVVGIHLVARRSRSTLILVHRTQLLDQWRTQLSVFLDLKPSEIGQIGGGRRKVTGRRDGLLNTVSL